VARFTDIIGTGWAFPVQVDERRGGIALSRQDQEIEEAIQFILSTPRGYRVMRPEFGCRIHELMFAPINADTATAAIHYVRDALGYWEPRIDVLDVDILPDPAEPACLQILISYRLRASHDERALVYPFYTIPGEA
jgi:phage baseplate assembly protein W